MEGACGGDVSSGVCGIWAVRRVRCHWQAGVTPMPVVTRCAACQRRLAVAATGGLASCLADYLVGWLAG
jgi:hypothetical protein